MCCGVRVNVRAIVTIVIIPIMNRCLIVVNLVLIGINYAAMPFIIRKLNCILLSYTKYF